MGIGNMAYQKNSAANPLEGISVGAPVLLSLWQLDVAEVAGHNLEVRGREEVNCQEATTAILHTISSPHFQPGPA